MEKNSDKRLDIAECRSLLGNKKLSDKKILSQRDRLYILAKYLIEKFEDFTNFITRVKTIEAKARIVR